MSEKVTLKSIAAHLDLSVSTVAKSLRNGRGLNAETVERVRKAADALGYVRNLDGVKLRTGNSFVIVAQIGMSQDNNMGDANSVGLLHGIHKRLEMTEYTVSVAPVFSDRDAISQLERAMAGRNADGVILDQIAYDDDRVAHLIERDIPFVTFGRDRREAEHAFFDLDNEKAAYDSTVAFIKAGARRIGCLEGDLKFQNVRHRLAGYRRALSEFGIEYDPTLVRHIDLEVRIAETHARQLIEIEKVDAISCVNEIALFGAYSGGAKAAGSFQEPVKLAAVTGTNIAKFLNIEVTACHFSRVQAGWELADMLLKLLDGSKTDPPKRVAEMSIQQH